MKLSINQVSGSEPECLGDLSFAECGHLLDDRLTSLAIRCVQAQQEIDLARAQRSRSIDEARAAVSAEALDEILARRTDIHGIASDKEISNVTTFNTGNIADSVHSERVEQLRCDLDRRMTVFLRSLFEGRQRLRVMRSGHFWYPRGSYMGWHTNNRAPGWRAYFTYAAEPGKSFFRYRDPQTGEIITSVDDTWNLRVFNVDPKVPLWHAVYSETDRFSFGYRIVERGLVESYVDRVRSLTSARPG